MLDTFDDDDAKLPVDAVYRPPIALARTVAIFALEPFCPRMTAEWLSRNSPQLPQDGSGFSLRHLGKRSCCGGREAQLHAGHIR